MFSIIKIAHLNVPYLLAHFGDFVVLVSDYDIFAVTETWLSNNINDNHISIPDYFLHRVDRGTSIYVNKNIIYYPTCVRKRSQSFICNYFLYCLITC